MAAKFIANEQPLNSVRGKIHENTLDPRLLLVERIDSVMPTSWRVARFPEKFTQQLAVGFPMQSNPWYTILLRLEPGGWRYPVCTDLSMSSYNAVTAPMDMTIVR